MSSICLSYAHQNHFEMGMCAQLHPMLDDKRTYLPPICHTLLKKDKSSLCQCVQNVKDWSQGYSWNIKSIVSIKDLKLVG